MLLTRAWTMRCISVFGLVQILIMVNTALRLVVFLVLFFSARVHIHNFFRACLLRQHYVDCFFFVDVIRYEKFTENCIHVRFIGILQSHYPRLNDQTI